jgi:hypothetical protein
VELYRKIFVIIIIIVEIKEIYLAPIFSSIIATKGEKHIDVNVIMGIKKYPSFISTLGESVFLRYDI